MKTQSANPVFWYKNKCMKINVNSFSSADFALTVHKVNCCFKRLSMFSYFKIVLLQSKIEYKDSEKALEKILVENIITMYVWF